jgi:uncharacterized protein (TIGR03437 family)
VGALAVSWDVVMNYTPAETPTPSRPTLISTGGVVHGATLRAGAVSGSWVTLQGQGLAQTTRTWREADIVDGRLPESLDGVSVRVNNQAAAVYYVSPTQINALAPNTAAESNVPVVVTGPNGSSDAVTVSFRPINPGFFQHPDERLVVVRTDGSVADSVRPGETVLVFGTGFGPTNPVADPSRVMNAALPTANPVRVQIHTSQAAVEFAGLVSPGTYQINLTVPDLPAGDYPVVAEVGGVRTAKFVRLRVG